MNAQATPFAQQVVQQMSSAQKDAVVFTAQNGWTETGKEIISNSYISLVITLTPGKSEKFRGDVMEQVTALVTAGAR